MGTVRGRPDTKVSTSRRSALASRRRRRHLRHDGGCGNARTAGYETTDQDRCDRGRDVLDQEASGRGKITLGEETGKVALARG
jgi:hypothetical protein